MHSRAFRNGFTAKVTDIRFKKPGFYDEVAAVPVTIRKSHWRGWIVIRRGFSIHKDTTNFTANFIYKCKPIIAANYFNRVTAPGNHRDDARRHTTDIGLVVMHHVTCMPRLGVCGQIHRILPEIGTASGRPDAADIDWLRWLLGPVR